MTKRESDRKEKHAAIKRFLFDEYVLVHVDPSQPGVSLPAHLSNQVTVTLKLSKLFRGNLSLEDDGVSAELLFSGSYFNCQVPLDAIWGVSSMKGKQLIWPASVPEKLADETPITQSAAKAEPATSTEASEPAKEIRRGHLTRVK